MPKYPTSTFTIVLNERERIVLRSAIDMLLDDARHKGWREIDVFDDLDVEGHDGADVHELRALQERLTLHRRSR